MRNKERKKESKTRKNERENSRKREEKRRTSEKASKSRVCWAPGCRSFNLPAKQCIVRRRSLPYSWRRELLLRRFGSRIGLASNSTPRALGNVAYSRTACRGGADGSLRYLCNPWYHAAPGAPRAAKPDQQQVARTH